jgi:ankyrin repeat protein
MNRSKLFTLVLVPLALALSGVTTESHAQANNADLLDAAAGGNLGLVNMLLQLNADPNATDSTGYTALMYAAQSGHIDVVGALLDAGADVNAASQDGWTPLLLTAFQGQTETLNFLLTRGADMSAKLDVLTPLMVAAVRGNTETAAALIDAGARVDEALDDGQTALMAAAEAGNTDVVQMLLEKGADPNAETDGGSTAAAAAARGGHTEVLAALAAAGAVLTAGLDSPPADPTCPDFTLPDSLQDVSLEGRIVVEFVVDTAGEVEDSTVTVVETPHDGLVDAATEMFQGCVFTPGSVGGVPARTRIRQALTLNP